MIELRPDVVLRHQLQGLVRQGIDDGEGRVIGGVNTTRARFERGCRLAIAGTTAKKFRRERNPTGPSIVQPHVVLPQ